eukprot:scpid72963/ scgid33475/ 
MSMKLRLMVGNTLATPHSNVLVHTGADVAFCDEATASTNPGMCKTMKGIEDSTAEIGWNDGPLATVDVSQMIGLATDGRLVGSRTVLGAGLDCERSLARSGSFS